MAPSDHTYQAFVEELASLQKEGMIHGLVGPAVKGMGRFMAGGVHNIMNLGQVGRSAARHGGVLNHINKIYRAGATATKHNAGGMASGVGAVLRSRYGQMAAIPAAAYATKRLLD